MTSALHQAFYRDGDALVEFSRSVSERMGYPSAAEAIAGLKDRHKRNGVDEDHSYTDNSVEYVSASTGFIHRATFFDAFTDGDVSEITRGADQ